MTHRAKTRFRIACAILRGPCICADGKSLRCYFVLLIVAVFATGYQTIQLLSGSRKRSYHFAYCLFIEYLTLLSVWHTPDATFCFSYTVHAAREVDSAAEPWSAYTRLSQNAIAGIPRILICGIFDVFWRGFLARFHWSRRCTVVQPCLIHPPLVLCIGLA